MPPLSSSATPFSRSVTVMITCRPAWPAICFLCPFATVLFCFFLRFFQPPPQLFEGRVLVLLLLEIEVVHLLFCKINDLAVAVVHRRLAVPFDGGRRDNAFAGRFAAEEVEGF